jgi:ATP-dependent Clp protease ATP-binding subunit ClpC
LKDGESVKEVIKPMKGVFTDRAEHVFHLAQKESRDFGRNVVSSEHLFLALIDEKSVASDVLRYFTIEVNEARYVIEEIIGRGDQSFVGELPLSEAVRRAIELAIHEANQFQHSYVGPEHLLLGLLHLNDGTIILVLRHFKTTPNDVQERITALFNGTPL